MTRSPLRITLLVILGLIASLVLPVAGTGQPLPALAASHITWVAQVPSAPYAGDTVHVWVNSDTVPGETAALEYHIGSTYTRITCSYDTSYSGANWRCDIPGQSAGTTVSYQLFVYNQSNQPYDFTGFNWSYTPVNGNIHWDGLFADQSPFFMSPVEPRQGDTLIVRFRSQHNDLTSLNLQWYDSGNPGNGWNNSIPMAIVGQDATGQFDIWQADASALLATNSTKFYQFQAIQGNATTYYNAFGPTCGGGSYTQYNCQPPNETSNPESFWVIPGFSTPAWSQSAIFYQIFPDRFRNGDPPNDIAFKASSEQDPSCPNAGWNYDPNHTLCYDPSTAQSPPCQSGWNEDTTRSPNLCYDPNAAVGPNPCPTGSYLYGGTCAYEHASWNELPQQRGRSADFFGGDLAGINQEIDPYLKQTLGVNALYLNPIFESPSNHKYDTQDYYTVDPHFGTNQGSGPGSLTSLIGTAHSTSDFTGDQRMSVMLDGVFNHTGDWNCWFNRVQNPCGGTKGAWQDPTNSPYASWYKFLPGFDQQTAPNNYCAWSGFGSLPQLNYSSQQVRDKIYATSGSVMQSYLAAPYNIDGWRLDVADNYSDLNSAPSSDPCEIGVDNHQIWQQIRPDVKGVNAQALILGEYWQRPTDWLGGDQWDSVMNYNGFNVPVSRFFTSQNVHGEPDGGLAPSDLANWLKGTLADNNRSSQLSMLNSLTTHDTSRFLYRACTGQGGTGDQCSSLSTIQSQVPAALAKLKMATELQMTYVGMPSIYYGDEIGTTGGNDPDNRRTFDWNTADWNTDVLNTTRTLIANRQAHPAFQNGTFQVLLADNTNNVFAFGRALYDPTTIQGNGQNTVAPSDAGITILNNDSASHNETINAAQLSLADGAVLTDILSGSTYTVANGTISVTLPANTGAVLVTGAAASAPALNLPGTPANASAQRGTGTTTVTWNPPVSGGPVYGYTVTPSPSQGTSVGPIACDGSTPPVCSVTIIGTDANTPYTFTVSAYNFTGAGTAATPGVGTLPATHLDVSAPGTALAGSAIQVQVTARNAQNGVVTGYTGTVALTSGDSKAVLPASHTFASGDAGTYTFTVTLNTPGSQSITATDAAVQTITGTTSVSVSSVPSAPPAILAVPGDGQAIVRWSQPLSTGNSPITGYTVSCVPSCGTPMPSGNGATITGLTNGTAYTVSVTANNVNGSSEKTSVTVKPAGLAVKYSHPLTFAVSARDLAGHPLPVAETGALPTGLIVAGGATGTATVAGVVTAAAGMFPISFTASGLSIPATITVTPRSAVVTPASANQRAVLVTGTSTAGSLMLTATITDSPDGYSGIISRALPVTFALQPVGGGTARTCIAALGTLSGGAEIVRCLFPAGIGTGAYDVHITTSGSYYAGSSNSVLAVYSQRNGAGGGGLLTNPVTHAPAEVAISVQNTGGVPQGGIVYVEHRSTGDVVVESTALSALSIVTGAKGALPRTATITGTASENGSASLSFTVTAIDNHDPNLPPGYDQFRLQAASGSPLPDLTFGAPVSIPSTVGGNLFVGTA